MHDAGPKSVSASDADVHVASLDEIKGYSGIEFLRRIASGEVAQPPIAKTLGFVLAEVAPGFALFTMAPEFRHYNPIGSVHGGVAATLLDSCMSCAIQTHLEQGRGYITLELKVNMVRPITESTGPIRAEGRVPPRRPPLRHRRGQDHRCQRHLARPRHDHVLDFRSLA